MAARQVRSSRRGITLIELMVTVAICAVLVGIGANAMTAARKVGRVAGQARLILQRLQSVRASAVSQGAAQGYYFGPNGPGAGFGVNPDADQGFVFWKLNPADPVVNYVAGTDRADFNRDTLPMSGTDSLVVVTGPGVLQPAPFSIGFDINGSVTVTPGPVVFPYCITVRDVSDPVIVRSIILFNDGTAKVQLDETWCP